MASIKDVAQRAGVGVATVSRVLNETGYVSEDARRKVEMAVAELNYIPNELARNLFHQKSGIIAIIIPKISHPFFAEFVQYAEMELMKNGFKTMICSTFSEKNYEKEYLNMLDRQIVDGVIAGSHTLDLEDYSKISKPIVALDRFLGDAIPVVAVNHKQGGRLAAEEMLASNCKCVLQFQGARVVDSPSHERHYEFERIMKKNGVRVYSHEMEWNEFDFDSYTQMAMNMVEKYPEIDGVFAVDTIAMAYIKALEVKTKKKCPKDVKVIAYDGTYLTDIFIPQLTVIKQPIEELAKKAVNTLSRMIEGKTHRKKTILEPQLVKGESTA